MDENLNDNASLMVRIQQLEQERDELRKDIEQLCLQQAGPSYLLVATKMHFQRTAGLEQEIENLKKKLSACSRESLNLQEELSEAYRIKSQLADLHNAEVVKRWFGYAFSRLVGVELDNSHVALRKIVMKRFLWLSHFSVNKEAEKQVKFFQGCVAAAFAERDNAIMEAEKAKEKEEFMSRKFNDLQRRYEYLNFPYAFPIRGLTIEELSADCIEQKKYTEKLQVDLTMEEEQNETFKKVINKFYEIKRHSLEVYGDVSWDDKCAILLDDPTETWSYNDASTAKYISALEEELQTLRNSIDKLQNKLLVGLEIENHLKRRVLELEKKRILADEMIRKEIAGLRNYHSRHKVDIMNLLGDGMTHIKSIIGCIDEKIRQFDISRAQDLGSTPKEVNQDEYECRDVHINTDVGHDLLSEIAWTCKVPLDQVATLLLLSQQEERYLLDRNVNAALQKKIEELQRNLLQVTNEKVRALMELAHLKQEYRLLKEKLGGCVDKESLSAEIGDKKPDTQERDGRLRNLLKKANLKRWVGTLDFRGNEAEVHMDGEGNFSSKRFNSIDFARMKIENATLKESMESMEHLITSIHRLRLSLLKAKESVTSQSTGIVMSESLDEIINEAKLVKTALGSSLPISWSAEAEIGFDGENISNESGDSYGNASSEKIDSVSAAGFEMVELLILAAHILKEYPMKSNT
ncbi:hypothetical protein FEM48_Zijuj09G0138400 [Ziziphus jujuba var. spinosa]|uniref:Uncharacterized protein n=1 Tax=Ziziphus jujuba var. spinosa TaxID=714518 RepID=A0A978UTC2_ZIZJJ|nr:hypothetical protein FEM48_Zijuj09G0138400 [Ziziphus jujuba var. spinosa]